MADITDSVIAHIFNALHLPPPPHSRLIEIAKLKKKTPNKLSNIPAFGLLLNLVKSKVEMTYELVMSLQSNIIDGHLSTDSIQEWEDLLGVISESLEFLKEVVSREQQHIISDMQASFFGSTGML